MDSSFFFLCNKTDSSPKNGQTKTNTINTVWQIVWCRKKDILIGFAQRGAKPQLYIYFLVVQSICEQNYFHKFHKC